MRHYFVTSVVVLSAFACLGLAQDAGPYKVLKTVKVGGVGGFDYVDSDQASRRLFVARSGATGAR